MPIFSKYSVAPAVLAVSAWLACCSASPATPDQPERRSIDDIMSRVTDGGSRSDLLDRIERNEAERAQQDKERAEREAEIRAILFDISEKLFSIRMSLAEIRGDRPNCRVRRRQEASLAAEAADLDRLAAAAGTRCRSSDTTQPAVAQLCNARLAEIATEKAAIEKARQTILGGCANSTTGDEDGKR